MKIPQTSFIIFILAFFNCRNESSVGSIPGSNNANVSIPSRRVQPKATNLHVLDTTIKLKGVTNIDLKNDKFSAEVAQRELYKCYNKQRIVPRHNPAITAFNASDRVCVDYDTMYNIQLNNIPAAVISYWLGACDLNGTGFRPTRAIIVLTKFGYRITNVEFIPRNFVIDSVAKAEIYGYDRESVEREVIKRFKITLKD